MNLTRESLLIYIREVFSGSDPHKILDYLDQYGIEPYELERVRVQHAIVQLSQGDEVALLNLVAAAKLDYPKKSN